MSEQLDPNFVQELERINALASSDTSDWSDVKNALDRLHRNVAQDMRITVQVEYLEKQIRIDRRSRFQKALSQLRDDIYDNQIPDDAAFFERRNALMLLSKPDDKTHELRDVTEDWDNRNRVMQSQRDVNNLLQHYQLAIENGMDFSAAHQQFIEPAEQIVEDLLQDRGMRGDITKLAYQIKQTIRDNDQMSLATNVVENNFQKVIEELTKRPENYRQPLFDEDGIVRGESLPRAEALRWYENRAIAFATHKARQYLEQAEDYLNHGLPIMAEYRLKEARQLYLLPEESRDDIKQFEAEQLKPILDRINNARALLESLLEADSIESALAAYRDATHHLTGWPAFDQLAEQEAEARQSSEMPDIHIGTFIHRRNLASAAREHIHKMMESRITAWLRQMPDSDSPKNMRLLYSISQKDFDEIRSYLTWGSDQKLLTLYGPEIDRLQAAYTQQREIRSQVDAAVARARASLDARQYADAYRELNPWQEIIEGAPEYFPQALEAWNESLAFYQTRRIKSDVDNAVERGIDRQDIAGQLDSLRQLQTRVESSLSLNPEKAQELRLGAASAELAEFIGLLEGIQALDAGSPEQAVIILQRSIPSTSRFFSITKEFMLEANSRITVDRELENALADAERLSGDEKWREAYNILQPHANKHNARNFEVMTEMAAVIKERFTSQLIAEIEENIVDRPADPQPLQALVDELQRVNIEAYNETHDVIKYALKFQTALMHEEQALGTQDPGKWLQALQSWDALHDPQFKDKLNELRKDFTEATLANSIELSVQAGNAVQRAQQNLNSALDTINQFARDVPDAANEISVMRLKVYTRLAEVCSDLSEVETNNLLARDQLDLSELDHPEQEDFAARHQAVSAFLEVTRALQSNCTITSPLSQWIQSLEKWQSAAQQAPRAIGLDVWFETIFRPNALQMQETIIAHAKESWEYLEPFAKRLLFNMPVPDDLRDCAASLYHNTDVFLADYSGKLFVGLEGELAYLDQLQQGGIALYYLMCDSLQVPDSTDVIEVQYCLDNNMLEIIAVRVVTALKTRQGALNQIVEKLRDATDLVEPVCKSGSFEMINNELELFDPGGQLEEFAVHHQVKALKQEVTRYQEQHSQLRARAREVEHQFNEEDFIGLFKTAEELQTAEARRFNAAHIPNVTDRFALNADGDPLPLHGLVAILPRVKRKQDQIDQILNWLTPIVSSDKVLEIVRSVVMREAPVDFNKTTIVNFAEWDVHVKRLRDQSQFPQAIELTYRIEIGYEQPTDSAARSFDADHLSLNQAQHLLADNVPFTHTNELISDTAKWLADWVQKLWTELDRQYAYVLTRRRDLERTSSEFLMEMRRFDSAYELLERQRSPFRLGVSSDALQDLYDAYYRIKTGPPTPVDQVLTRSEDGKAYELYPLAPLYDGLETRFAKYRNRG